MGYRHITNQYRNVYPQPGEVIEISRRIKVGQRPLFKFLGPLRDLVSAQGLPIVSSPDNVRVNLISRYDNLTPQALAKTAALNVTELTELFKLSRTSTCGKYATLTLGEPVIHDKDDGWQTVEMPIEDSDYPFDVERQALAHQIGETLADPNIVWHSESPALHVVEFMADATKAEAILEFVGSKAPKQTEVFDASIRFRPSAIQQ